MTTADEIRLSYLKALASEDAAEAEAVRSYRAYYDGEHPTYLSDRMKEFLSLTLKYDFADNYCAPVVDIAAERLAVQAFDGGEEEPGATLATRAWEWWTANRMDQRQDELHLAAIKDSEAYLVVDWESVEARPRWTVNNKFDGTRGVKVHRHPDTSEIIYASKRWYEDNPTSPGQTGTPRLTLYFADRVERYRANVKAAGGWAPVVSNENGQPVVFPTSWVDKAGQPLGVAVIPFTNPRGSEIQDVIPPQDMLNKTLLDLVAAADVDGFGITYVSGVQKEIDPATGVEREIVLGPGKLIRLSNPQARMGRVAPDDLTRLLSAADFWIGQIAAVSRTPQHLFQRWRSEPPSGESLKQQEIGLLAKTGRKQVIFGNAYEDVIALSIRLANTFGAGKLETARLSTTWRSAEIRDEKAHLEALGLKKGLGVPEEQIWREMGYDQGQVDQFRRQREASRDQAIGLMVQQVIGGQGGDAS